MPRPLPALLVATALITLLIAVWAPSLRGAEFVFDDRLLLARHAHDGDVWGEWRRENYGFATGLQGRTWTPLASFAQHVLAQAVGRAHAAPFRVLNLVVHGSVVLLVVASARALGGGWAAATAVGALAAVHPITPPTVCVGTALPEMLPALAGLVGLLGVLRAPPRWAPAIAAVTTLVACLGKSNGLLVWVPLVLVTRSPWVALGGIVGDAVYVGWLTAVLHGFAGEVGQPGVLTRLAAWLELSALPFAPPWSQLAHAVRGGVALLPGVGLAAAGIAAWRLREARIAQGVATWFAVSAPSGTILAPISGFLAFRYAYGALLLALPFVAAPTRGRRAIAVALAAAAIVSVPRTSAQAQGYRTDRAALAQDAAIESSPTVEVWRFSELAANREPVPPELVQRVWWLCTTDDPAGAGVVSRMDLPLLAEVALAQRQYPIAEGAALAALDRRRPDWTARVGCTLAAAQRAQGKAVDPRAVCR